MTRPPVRNTVTNPKNRFADFAILTAGCLVVYLQVMSYLPVYDDVEFIAHNAITHDPWALLKIFGSTYTGLLRADITYRPLTVWSFALNYAINGWLFHKPMQPVLFHLVNLVSHCAVTCLFYQCLRRLQATRAVALATALLFAVLPIHTEAVTGIVGRAELFAALFGLLFLLAHLHSRQTGRACLFLLLAMFGKESGITFFPLAIALDYVVGKKYSFASQSPTRKGLPKLKWRPAYTAYAGTVGVWLFIRQIAIQKQTYILAFVDNPTMAGNLGQRFFTAARFQIEYITRSLFPYYLSSDASYNQIPIISSPINIYVAVFVLFFGSLSFWAWHQRRLQPLILAFLAWYLITFSLTSNFLRSIGSTVGERLAYTPSMAICALLVLALVSILKNREMIFRGVVGVMAILYGARTIHRNFSWKDELTFFKTQVEDAPRSAKAHYNYGTILAGQHRDAEAIPEYEKAIQIFPAYSEPFLNMGNALRRIGGPPEKIIEAYQNCFRYDAYNQSARGNLLIYLLSLGRESEARQVAAELKSINPNHPALQSFGLPAQTLAIPPTPINSNPP